VSVAGLPRHAAADALLTTLLAQAPVTEQRSERDALLATLLAQPPVLEQRAERLAQASLPVGAEITIPAPQVANTAAAPAAASQSYVVQPGDSLWAIATSFYGNGGLWPVIYNANTAVIGGNPHLIYPNQTLTIPTSTTQPPPSQPPQSGQGMGQYTVVSGDTLSGIALTAYGNANLWPHIYNANVAVIGSNPHLIIPGQVLTIPPV
jgi:nucleoid-associated protein YgaU